MICASALDGTCAALMERGTWRRTINHNIICWLVCFSCLSFAHAMTYASSQDEVGEIRHAANYNVRLMWCDAERSVSAVDKGGPHP